MKGALRRPFSRIVVRDRHASAPRDPRSSRSERGLPAEDLGVRSCRVDRHGYRRSPLPGSSTSPSGEIHVEGELRMRRLLEALIDKSYRLDVLPSFLMG